MLNLISTHPVLGPTRDFVEPAFAFVIRIDPPRGLDLRLLVERTRRAAEAVGLPSSRLSAPHPEETETAGVVRLFAELAMTLQRATDARVENWAVLPGESELERIVRLEAEHFRIAAYAGGVASEALNDVIDERPSAASEFASDLSEFLDYAAPRMLDPNARLLMAAARRRGLMVIDEDNLFEPDRSSHAVPHGLIQIGMGSKRQRYIG